jgi:hypothetical protein
MKKKILFSALITLVLSTSATAQLVPLEHWYTNEVNSLSGGDTVRFTAMKPVMVGSVPQERIDTEGWLLKGWDRVAPPRRSFGSRLLNGHLLEVHEDGVHLFVDPVLDLSLGKSGGRTEATYQSSRGIRLEGTVGEKFFFNTSFVESQARFPRYIDSAVRNNGYVVPGSGMARNFGQKGFDYSQSQAVIGFAPSIHFNAMLGYGKNFIGDGYRSLLLSDNAFSYPYLRLNAQFWRIHYTVLYNQYLNLRFRVGDSYQRKFATTHFASIRVGKKLELGLFENVLWQGSDSTGRGFELQYLNPVLFLRPVEFSVGSPDNSMFGFSGKYQVSGHTFLYSQFMLDDFNFGATRSSGKQHLNNKYGIQLGMWTNDLFKIGGLNYRLEYNTVRPYSYGHRKIAQNYTHYNQALAHPLGANFHEVVNQLSYSHGRWYGLFHSTLALIGEDVDGILYGNNLWGGEAGVPQLGSYTLQGEKTTLVYNRLQAGWVVNPAMNLRFEVELGQRSRVNDVRSQREGFFSVGVKTALGNFYHDF